MTCSCGGELYQFTAPERVKVPAAQLPAVCRSCGQITLSGRPVPLPAAMEEEAGKMASLAQEVSARETEALLADPEARVQKYFENVYTDGYMSGFFRALAFYQHQGKEGRLVRMRELWEQSFFSHHDHVSMALSMPSKVAEEFKQLLYLGTDRRKRAKGTQNKCPAGETSPSRV